MIGSLPNIAFVEDRATSLELLRVATLTATITGTAGWEALCCGRPALGFGNVFWRSLPGALHIDDEPSWDDVTEFSFDSAAFSKAVGEMGRRTYRGVADLDYSVIVDDFDRTRNSRTLAESLAEHMRHAENRRKGTPPTA